MKYNREEALTVFWETFDKVQEIKKLFDPINKELGVIVEQETKLRAKRLKIRDERNRIAEENDLVAMEKTLSFISRALAGKTGPRPHKVLS